MRHGRLAIVTPWFGADLTGGAERLAFQVAHALHDRGHRVVVLTTCGRSFQSDWSRDARPAGISVEDGLEVRRFPLDARDRDTFDRANAALLAAPRDARVPEAARVAPGTETAFVDESVRSRALEEAVARADEQGEFDRILFVPYLYGPTSFALPRVAERAALQPCLHDEIYAYLPRVAATVRAARTLLFNGESEAALARRLFGPETAAKGTVVGHWVEPPAHAPHRPRIARHPYVLYLGRRDRSKNVHLLLRAFEDLRRYDPTSTLRLVLAGPGATSFDRPDAGIHDLGVVDDDTKWSLVAHARAIVQPSTSESFSRALLEGWALGRPALVHGACGATADAVRSSRGGFVATTRAEWTRELERIDAAAPRELAALGAGGRAYYATHSSPEAIVARYEAALFPEVPSDPTAIAPPDVATMRALADGRALVLYAGAVVGDGDALPALVTAFAFSLSYGVDAKLAILGRFSDEAARASLAELLARHGLAPRVVLETRTDAAVVRAYLRSASLYLSLADEPSAPEAFGEARRHGLPIVAYDGRGVRAALGPAGIVVTSKDDPARIGALASVVLRDEETRAQLVRGALAS